MPTTRVVPTFTSKGLYTFALAIGIVHGIVLYHAGDYFSTRMALRAWSMGVIVGSTLTVAILPWVLFTILLARQTRRRRPPFVAVPLMSASLVLTMTVYGICRDNTAGAAGGTDFWEFIIPFVICIAAALGIAALTRWLALHRVSPLEQTGLLCWHCSYDLGTPSITICPECAEPANPAVFRAAWFFTLWRRTSRAGPILLALVLALGLPWAAYRFITIRLPCEHFLARLNPRGQPAQQWMYIRNQKWESGPWNGLLAVQPLPDTTDQAIAYAFWPRQPELADRPVRMRVFLCQPMASTTVTATTINGGTTIITVPTMPSEGSLRIYADLSPAQAELVLKAGHAPDSLIQMLRTKAVENDWQPVPSTNWGPNYSAQEVPIDPEQHFKSLPSTAPKQQPADTPGR